jgi:hypothetical protein
VEKNSTLVAILVGVVGALAVAVLAINAALKVYEATLVVVQAVQKATWLSALGPIGLVIAAVLAIVAVIVICYKKFSWFKAGVDAIWRGIKAATAAVIGFIRKNWILMVASLFGPFGIAAALIIKNWQKIKDTAGAVMSWLRSAWRATTGAITSALHGIGSAASSVWNAIRSAVQAVIHVVQDLIGWLKKITMPKLSTAAVDNLKQSIEWLIGKVQDLIGWLGRIKVPSIHLPHIPGVTGLAAPAVAAPFPVTAGRGLYATPAGVGRSAGGEVHIHIDGLISDPEGTARAIRRLLSNHDRRLSTRGDVTR